MFVSRENVMYRNTSQKRVNLREQSQPFGSSRVSQIEPQNENTHQSVLLDRARKSRAPEKFYTVYEQTSKRKTHQ